MVQIRPNVEAWEEKVAEGDCPNCGVVEYPVSHDDGSCPCCAEGLVDYRHTDKAAAWFWFCYPGCLPDSDVFGPFLTEAAMNEALEDLGEGESDDN